MHKIQLNDNLENEIVGINLSLMSTYTNVKLIWVQDAREEVLV